MRSRPHFWVSERAVTQALVRELRLQLAAAESRVQAAELRAKQAADRASELANALARQQAEQAKARGCYGACITPFMGLAEAEKALERRRDGQEAR